MSRKKYPELFERIKEHTVIAARNNPALTEAEARTYIRCESHKSYKFCCKLIAKGYRTPKELMEAFPLQ